MEAVLEVFRCIDDPAWLNRACEEEIPHLLQGLSTCADLPIVMDEIELVAFVRKVRNLLINSTNERVILVSLNLLSWITSGCINGGCIDGEISSCVAAIARLAQSKQRNCRLMSLFLRATCGIPWIKNSLCKDTLESTLCCLNDADSQVCYWAYRTVVNEAMLHGNAYLSIVGDLQPYVNSAMQGVLESLSTPEQRIGLLRNTSADGGPLSLVLIQIEFLLFVPDRWLFTKHLKAVLELCPVVCTSISDVLKRGPVPAEAVASCCTVWRLLVRVCSLLLLEPKPQKIDNPGDRSNVIAHAEVMAAMGTAAERREAFMNLLAPKNGVGVLAAPLQYVLKRSKLQAALCYEAIAVAITQDVKNWHEPPAVLKLLLRCLHHLLCSDAALTTSRSTNAKSPSTAPAGTAGTISTSLSKRRRQGDGEGEEAGEGAAPVPLGGATGTVEAGGLVQDNLEQEWDEVEAAVEVVQAAGKALTVLSSAVDRRNLDAVLAVSVSMGRPAQRTGSKSDGTGSSDPDRTSLGVILSRLLGSGDGIQIDTLRPLDLIAVQKVYTAATGTARLHRQCQWYSSATANQDKYEQSDGILCDRQPHHLYRKGLFAIDMKLGGKRSSIADDEVLNNATILAHLQRLHSAMERVVVARAWELRMREQLGPTADTRIDMAVLEGPISAHSCTAELVASFQSCVIALVQGLYAELAPLVETSPERSGKSPGTGTPAVLPVVEHAIGPSGMPLQGVALGPTPRAAPQLFAYSSQLSQPFQPRHRGMSMHGGGTKQSPVLPTIATNPGGESYAAVASQVLLGSAHPPAVQAALDLCGFVIKMWVGEWINSAPAEDISGQRELVVEALWWFLQRTSTFAVEMRTEDLALLQGAVETLQPSLCPARCPDNAAGVVMLLALSHAHIAARSCSSNHQHPSPIISVNIVERAVECCMTSMTEVGVLPSLFEWLPRVLAANNGPQLDDPSGAVGTTDRSRGRDIVLSVEVRNGTADTGQSQSSFLCQRLIGKFIALSLEQLAGMTLPTASEQHSPGLMSSMISGLGHLLVSPLVMAIQSDEGILSMFSASTPVREASALSASPPLANWRKILQIWLELREVARSHGIDGDSIHTESEETPSIAWVDGLLGIDASALVGVPFRGVSCSVTRNGSDHEASHGSLATADCVLQLARATVDCVVQHRRQFSRSELTDVFAATAAGLLASVAGSLQSILFGVDDTGRVFSILNAVKDMVGSLLSVVSASSALLAGPPLIQVVIALQYHGCDQQPPPSGYAVAIFSSILQLVVCVHNQHRAVPPQDRSALLKRCEQQWLLTAITGLCAAHSTSASAQGRGAFRSAAASLSAGREYRHAVMQFAQQVGATLDTECVDMLLSAWTELGGDAKEIQRVLQSPGVSVAADTVVRTEDAIPSALAQSSSLVKSSTPSTGAKRSFIPAPAPVMSRGSTSPPASHKKAKSNAVTDRPQPSDAEFVKMGAAQSDLDALAAKAGHGSRARQGIVPATYTGADRTDLNAQSQQQLQSQQLPSQRIASQAMANADSALPPLYGQPNIATNRSVAAGAMELRSPSGPDTTTITALPPPLPTQPHSDSTTYVSPSPAQVAGQQLSSAAITRLQSGYFHSHLGSLVAVTSVAGMVTARSPDIITDLPPVPPRDVRTTAEQVNTEVADLQRHSQIAQLEISSEGGDPAANNGTASGGPAAITEPPLADLSADAAAAGVGQSSPRTAATTVAETAAAVLRTQQRLRACIDELLTSSGSTINGEDQGLAPGVAVEENVEDALSAAIRDSHRLTGLLLELWNRSRDRKT